ncbi:MAG TPA: hypothetical protein VFO21_05315 [Vicinamibacterales bacterium]|nr:hypothetical protein [Vicinamibacterales bacterium]
MLWGEPCRLASRTRRVRAWEAKSALEGRTDHELDLPRGCRGFRNRAELRRVDEPVRRGVVHRVEEVERVDPEMQIDGPHGHFAIQRAVGLTRRPDRQYVFPRQEPRGLESTVGARRDGSGEGSVGGSDRDRRAGNDEILLVSNRSADRRGSALCELRDA